MVSVGLRFLTLVLLLSKRFIRADYVATLSGCPAGYQRINNGCYFIMNGTSYNQATAEKMCTTYYNSSDKTIVTHLLALESLAETIALSYWFKGFSYDVNFWSDGIRVNAYTRAWSWSMQDYYQYGYLKDSVMTNKDFMYLFYNGTAYEVRDDAGTTSMSFICEAQVPCQASDNMCKNNGTCYVNSGRVLCTCIPGFVGVLCEQQIDNCDSGPCKHGATCNNLVNNYTCECTKFYSGRNCDVSIPDEYQNYITLVVSIFIACNLLVLLILSLMDLPWELITKKLCPKKKPEAAAHDKQDNEPDTDENESGARRNDKSNRKSKKSKSKDDTRASAPSKAQLIASEQEMLRRLKSALNNSPGNQKF